MVEPWERISWPEEYQQVMYRDWGTAFTSKDQLDIAIDYYKKSINLNPEDVKALYFRSKCYLKLAETEHALDDAKTAAAIKKRDVDIDLAMVRALYELNRFEDAKIEMHNKTRIYVGRKVKEFENLITVHNEHFNDSLGSSYGPFIMKASRYFDELFEEMKRRSHVEKRPLWKILREAGKCDVMSILEKEDELLHPREVARRERAFRVFNQLYMNKSWKDISFLKNMRQDSTLCWEPSKMSAPFLKNMIDVKYSTVKRFEKMLHARSPLYNELMVKFGSKKMMDKNREIQLYRVQYQTRRNMNTILKTIKKLRELKQVEKLARYIEKVMGDYVVLKTYRVMPWKFEFINDVYNTLALAYADRYLDSPEVGPKVARKNRLLVKLRLPTEYKEKPAFVFGDKSTYQEPDAIDYAFIAYKKHLARLEKRLNFAVYPIERCYLYHEIARAHLKQNHFAESINAARKSIEVVNLFNNQLWALLSYILIVKANALVYKVENIAEALKGAHELSLRLNSPELNAFIEACKKFNDADIEARKRVRSADVERTRKSRSLSRASSAAGSQMDLTSLHSRAESIDAMSNDAPQNSV